jgi:hypothetical protein
MLTSSNNETLCGSVGIAHEGLGLRSPGWFERLRPTLEGCRTCPTPIHRDSKKDARRRCWGRGARRELRVGATGLRCRPTLRGRDRACAIVHLYTVLIMKARYIQEIGTRGQLRIYWDLETLTGLEPLTQYPGEFSRSFTSGQTCPNSCGGGKPGYHNAMKLIRDDPTLDAWGAFGRQEDYPAEEWPTHCSDCGALVPEGSRLTQVGQSGFVVHHQIFSTSLYNTASGKPEPGDLYESRWHQGDPCPFWDNCSGLHLWAILPNGDHWDIDSRASNCTMRDDRTHRCWIRTGSLENGMIHVDKNGHTCAAGAGSIAVPGWHGFLHHGHFNG